MPSRAVEKKRALAERRRQVWNLRVVRQASIRQIADAVGVSEPTVERDLLEVRKHSRTLFFAMLEDEAAALDVGLDICAKMDAVEAQAWSDIVSADAGSSERARFLTVVQFNVVQRVKLLQSLGLVKQVAEEYLIHHGATRTSGLSDAELDDIIAFYEAALARGETPASGQGAAAEPGAVDGGEPLDP